MTNGKLVCANLHRRLALACIMVLFGGVLSARACEPVVPFVQVMGGPAVLANSLLGLLIAVLSKAVIFGVFQKELGFLRGASYMLIGNLLTTFVGVVAGAMIGSSAAIWLIGIPIVFALCLLPATRLVGASRLKWVARWSPGSLASTMTGMLIVSCLLFSVVGLEIGDGRKWQYWLVKLAAVYLALLVSICLTAYWEEWVIWKLSRSTEGEFAFVKPVVRANLLVLLGIMAVAAAMMLPKRLKSPDFLVSPRAANELRVNND